MAILNFVKPDKVVMINSTETEGQFEFRPLEPGFGITIGNSLRRILLSSLEGHAITSVRIEGVDHEFSTIKCVVEDVTEIILNLKQVRFKKQLDNHEVEKIVIHFAGNEKFTAGEIGKFANGFQILNPDLVIFNCESSVKLKIELTIDKGRGYVPAEENKTNSAPQGTIFIDSIYTPIKNVKYTIENYRVEQKTDYEKLILDIVSDGSIHPKEALKEAAKILIHHFMLFSDEKITLDSEEKKSETKHMIFRYNESAVINHLDPAHASHFEDAWSSGHVFNGLVQLNQQLKIEPCIAKKWTISEDQLEYTFILRNDVYFHDHSLSK